MLIERFQVAVASGTATLVLALAGCGGGAAREANQLSGLSILEATRPLERNMVKREEISKASDASGVRTLLQLWFTLQHANYQSATSYFEPAGVNSGGVAKLAVALRIRAPLWDSTKPTEVVASTKDGSARVFFVVHDVLGKPGSAEIVLRKVGPIWRISFLSLLQTAPPAGSPSATDQPPPTP
jgi:hypothetical protein